MAELPADVLSCDPHFQAVRQFYSLTLMTQDERWLVRYNEVMDFMEKNHRNPSKHYLEERLMHNWVHQNKKLESVLRGIWAFCSFLFVPQRGRAEWNCGGIELG